MRKFFSVFTMLILVFCCFGTMSYAKNTNSVNIYGVGIKNFDESYNGFGFKLKSQEYGFLLLEKADDYFKASGVLRYDVTDLFYIKGGLSYLDLDNYILNTDDVYQISYGFATGFGDEITYNIEAGYILHDLHDAGPLTDDIAKTAYVEGVYKRSFEVGNFDIAAVVKYNEVYNISNTDFAAELGYYPIDDLKFSGKYDSQDYDSENYSVKVGMTYTFGVEEGKSPWSPYVEARANTAKNLSFGLTWERGVWNENLKNRDFFEEQVATSNIKAEEFAPKEFNRRVKADRTPAISMNSHTISDDDGRTAISLPAPIVGGSVSGSVFSYTCSPNTSMLSINPKNGVITWKGDISGTKLYNINLVVVNDYGFNGSTNFTLTVNDDYVAPTINTAPTASNISLNLSGNETENLDLTAKIGDAEDSSSTLNIVDVSTPAHGTLTWSGKTFTYTANAGYVGSDSFTYRSQDSGSLKSSIATVSLTNIGTAPPISSPTISMNDQIVNDNAGFAMSLPAPTVTGDEIGAVYSIVGNPNSGMISINSSTGVITWEGDLDNPSDYTINIKITNTDGGSDTTSFNLHINDNL